MTGFFGISRLKKPTSSDSWQLNCCHADMTLVSCSVKRLTLFNVCRVFMFMSRLCIDNKECVQRLIYEKCTWEFTCKGIYSSIGLFEQQSKEMSELVCNKPYFQMCMLFENLDVGYISPFPPNPGSNSTHFCLSF